MKGNKLLQLIMLNLAVSGTAIAGNNISIVGSIPAFVHDTNFSSPGFTAALNPSGHYVTFDHVVLSPEARQNMANALEATPRALRSTADINSALPSSAYLGMNDVPVLDQGAHGTCATFANTGALDAILGHTDYISQLCNLDLGVYLSKQNKNYDSGWNGTTNETVVKQITTYGIVPMSYQTTSGCGASGQELTAYPLKQPKFMGTAMPEDLFTRHSEKIMDNISYNTILSTDDAFQPSTNMDSKLSLVKQALVNGHRVVLGTLIDEYQTLNQVNGASGNFQVKNDCWIMIPQIAADIQHDAKITDPNMLHIKAGHAVIIVGYDDNASVNGPDGAHKGILKLRNSWNSKAGNNGEYYMSYDFFNKMVTELVEIVPSKTN